ncbi:MAG: hypothetical protein RLZZ308_317 [Candidatus Parcubacteria bacterium]|jgi:hypothetical protein
MYIKYIITTCIAFSIITGTAHAIDEATSSPRILPGNPLYILKTITEDIGTLFTFGNTSLIKRYLTLAEQRLSEAQILTEQGNLTHAQKTIKKYEDTLEKALTKIDTKGVQDTNDKTEIIQKLTENTLRHQAVLNRVLTKVPDEAKDSIQKALTNSAYGHQNAIRSLLKNATTTTATTTIATSTNATSTQGNATSSRNINKPHPTQSNEPKATGTTPVSTSTQR